MNSWKAYSASCWLWKHFPCKSYWGAWRSGRWLATSQVRQKFIAQFIQLLKHWLCDVWSGVVAWKNWALSVHQCWLQALQSSVHLIDLLSILLRCNGFARIQKVVVAQMGSRPPNIMDLNWSLSPSDCWPLCSFSSRLLSPLQNSLNHHCTGISGQMRCCFESSPLLYNPFWTQIRKSF